MLIFLKRVSEELRILRLLHAEASPAFPIISDRFRLRRSDYLAAHRASGLSFLLKPKTGDWFTFYECCLRQDYFADGFQLYSGEKVLDIGGNFGAFSLMAALKVGSHGSVHCYEPSPTSADRIRWHIRHNDVSNIVLIPNAVGAKSEEISLFIHEKSALTTSSQSVDGRSSAALKSIRVDQIAISEALKALPGSIAIAKIDCEGAEYDIMDQISSIDLARIRAIALETHEVPGRSREDILSKLRSNGFEIRDGNPLFAMNEAHR